MPEPKKQTIIDNARISEHAREMMDQRPGVQIFLRPIAPPAALGLAGFAGSTFIVATYMTRWWGAPDSPTIFFPFVAFWGGLAQFIAGLFAFLARDTLTLIICTLWGSFWMSIGLLYFIVAAGYIPSHSLYTHFPELASWFMVLTAFTWSGAICAPARDLALTFTLVFLAIGSTIGLGTWFSYGEEGIRAGVKAAGYFFILSAIAAWYRVTVYLLEEAYGYDVFRLNLPGRLPREKAAAPITLGLGEPGVKRSMPSQM